MSEREYRVLERVIAISEDFRIYSILIVQEYIVTPKHGGVERLKGVTIARTTDGKDCKIIDDNTFEITELGQVAMKI